MAVWFFVACQISVIACAIVAGVFLTFSDFVMRSLDNSSKAAGIEVMQAINREVFKSVSMVLLTGMSALSPVLIAYASFNIYGPASTLIAAGGGVYLVGVFAVTLAFNVPMNIRLDRLDYSGAEAATYWTTTFCPDWSFWNYLQAIASAASSISYLIACLWLTQRHA